jgi:hypothetical protein
MIDKRNFNEAAEEFDLQVERLRRESRNVIWLVCILGALCGVLLAAYARAESPAMPDRKLTPGAVSNLTAKQLCNPKFHTGTVRAVSESEKNQVYAEYHMANHHGACAHGCEIDHLISLELGGSNDIRNLWPEPYAPAPNAHQKDIVENWLHKQVCAGALSLKGAQGQISRDWYGVYRRMTSAQQKESGSKR